MSLLRTTLIFIAMILATALSYAQVNSPAEMQNPCMSQMAGLEQLVSAVPAGEHFLDQVSLVTDAFSGKQSFVIKARDEIFVVDVRCMVTGGENNGGGGSGGRRERWPTSPSGETAKFHHELQLMEVSEN